MSQLKSYLLSFAPCLASESGLVDFFSTLFELKKLSVVKKKDKAVREVVLVIASDKNSEMLEQPSFGFRESTCTPVPISLEESEALILKNRTKLYVGAIPFGVDNIKVWNHFAQYGTLEYSYVIRKPLRNGKKGFGFVIFKSRHSLEKALAANHYIDGKKLITSEFSCKAKMHKSKGAAVSQEASPFTEPEVAEIVEKAPEKPPKKPLRRNHQVFNYEESSSYDFQESSPQIYSPASPHEYLEELRGQFAPMGMREDRRSFDCNYLQHLEQTAWYGEQLPAFYGRQPQGYGGEAPHEGLHNYRFRRNAMKQAASRPIGACYSCF